MTSNHRSKRTSPNRKLSIFAYALAAALLVATPTMAPPAEAAWTTTNLTGTQNRDSTVYWTTARWMTQNAGTGNAASARITSWDNATGIWSFSVRMRSSSSAVGSFASVGFTSTGTNYKALLNSAGSSVLPRTVFYMTTVLPMTAGGGSQTSRTFYGNLGYTG